MNKTTVIENRSTQKINNVESVSNFPKKSFRYILAVIPFALVLLISTSYQQNPEDINYLEQDYFTPGITDSLRNLLYEGSDQYLTINDNEYTLNKEYLRTLYFKTGYKPVWIRFDAISERASGLITLIENARGLGLEPEHYHNSSIKELNQQLSANKNEVIIKAKLDILLTDAALKLMINLHYGYCVLDSDIYRKDFVKEFPEILLDGIARNNVSNTLLSVEPTFIEYKNLRKACNLYIKSNKLTEETSAIIYPNKDSVILYSGISQALINLGYITKNNISISEALKEFQKYHGLKADGKPGINTVEALNKSTLYNYRVLALNLDRLRKRQYSSENMIYVNIPAYSLKVFNKNIIKDTFRVIVGNPSTPTPLISAYMERVIANPVWYVPKSIAMNEILPKIKADSNYLDRNGFKILDKNNKLISKKELNLSEDEFEYTFRQNRGSDNSLGQVKFIFANPYSVYIHDTPSKSLFLKDLRAFSHGCVRLQHPERLAEYILKLNSDTTDFARLLKKGQQRDFKVSNQLPIHITYITCEADEKGNAYFYKDIYGIDKKELEELLPLMGI